MKILAMVGLLFSAQAALLAGTSSHVLAQEPQFAADSTMSKIQKRGKLIVGSRFDQPNVAQMDPITGTLNGFDAEVARYVGKALGLAPDNVQFTEVISANREPAITQGLVDIVVSGYVITDKRRSVVGQAGPYALAHQRLFVHQDNLSNFKTTDDIKGHTVCAPATSTAVPIIEKFGGKFVPIDDNSVCNQQVANKLIDGKMGNDLLTVGFVKQYPGLALAEIPDMSDEGWGIGHQKDDAAFCKFLQTTLNQMISTGEWSALWDKHLKSLGLPAQKPPVVEDRC